MTRRPVVPVLVALAACQPTQLAQTCPAPAGAAEPLAVTQLLLVRGDTALGIGGSDFTLTLSASGDAFYAGSPTVPVPGQYLGRIRPEQFSSLVATLGAAGLSYAGTSAPEPATPGVCLPNEVISISFQTADARYGRTAFCAGSESEQRLAEPVYRLAEAVRWQPGDLAVTLRRP